MAEKASSVHANEKALSSDQNVSNTGERRLSVAENEAADLYGNTGDAGELGYVERGLKSRHIQFIALGGTIGTGLFLGIGGAFVTGGPLAILLGYSFTGFAVYAMMMSLGEMTTWLPLPGAIPQYCARYVDSSLAFAVGWNYWYASAITLCADTSAATILISYWKQDMSPGMIAGLITVFLLLVLALNIFAVKIYGEAEFCFASIKLITMVGLLIMSLVITLGGGPTGQRIGFHYWKRDGPFQQYARNGVIIPGSLGRFLSFLSTLVNAAYSYGGVEMVAIAAGEAENPLKNIPKAVKRVFWRILFFYVFGTLAIGMMISARDEDLRSDRPGAFASPWVIATKRAGIKGLDSVINAVILSSALSAGNAFLYTGSRYLFGVAQNKQAPKFFLKCTKNGIPIYCVGITALMGVLTYLTVGSGAKVVFGWFQNLTTIAQLFTWVSICIAYIRFRHALIAQGVDRNTLIFRSPFQPFTAWFALIFFVVIIVFNGFGAFIGKFNIEQFLIAYINVPIFFALYIVWKLVKRTPFVKASEADIWTGKHAIDNQVWPEDIPKNFIEKVWYWIA